MTRKEFVLNVVEEIKTAPRAVLAGHRLPAAVLQTISTRPDVMSKLAVALYSTKNAKKGAKGLKKSNTFRIFGYKNFMEFQNTAREDIENFIGDLPEEDANSFVNSDNILGIMMLPAVKKTGEETTEDEIISGKSVNLVFDQAINKTYGIAGAMYVLALFGNSIVRPAEEKLAARKEKVNKKKQARRSPAKVKAEIKAKAAKKLNVLDSRRADLETAKFNAEKELEQFGEVANMFGADLHPNSIDSRISKFDADAAEKAAVIEALTPEEKRIYNMAIKYWNAGKKSLAMRLLRELGNEEIINIVKSGGITSKGAVVTSSVMLNERKKAIKNRITILNAKNETLLAELESAPEGGRKRSIQSMLSKNTSEIRSLRAKLGTYKNISGAGMVNKSRMLKQVHADIEENIALGASIKEALDEALNKLNAKAAEKEIIKQQIVQQVAAGIPTQYAVQKAVQQFIPTNLDSSNLSGSKSIKDIINLL